MHSKASLMNRCNQDLWSDRGSKACTQCGISLIEVLVVVALLVVGLWMMMNVFPTGQRAIRSVRERNFANKIAERITKELTISAKLEGGLLPDNLSLYEMPLAELHRLDLPIDRNGDGQPDELPDGKRTIEDLIELRKRMGVIVGERLGVWGNIGLTALTPIDSIAEAYRLQSYIEVGSISEVTMNSNKYFVDYSTTPPNIVVRFSPTQNPKQFRISYIALVNGQRFVAEGEICQTQADQSGEARIMPKLLQNVSGQLNLLVLSVSSVVPLTIPTLTDEQKRAGVVPAPRNTFLSYRLQGTGAWISCWGRVESSQTGTVFFDPLPKPLIATIDEDPTDGRDNDGDNRTDEDTPDDTDNDNDIPSAGVAGFTSPLQALPDTEFEIKPDNLLIFSTLSPGTLIRLSYRCTRSLPQSIDSIDNWFFIAHIPPLSFTPSPSIVGGQIAEFWREYFLDNDKQKLYVAGMWSGLLVNVVYAGTDGNMYSILRRVEYDPKRQQWKGVISLPTPYEVIEKVEGASLKVRVSGRFFLGNTANKSTLNLGSVIEKEALIER